MISGVQVKCSRTPELIDRSAYRVLAPLSGLDHIPAVTEEDKTHG